MTHESVTPSGVAIVFEDGLPDPETGETKQRRYTVDGDRLPSVTTVLGCIDKSGPLMHWAVQETLEGRNYKETRDTAATRGTSVHDALEVLATAGTPPSLGAFPDEDQGYVQALCSWWIDVDPEPVLVEQAVASKEHGFAGRFDLLAEIDGVRTLCDLKTSKSVHPEMHFQIEAYRLALEEGGWTAADRGMILRVGEDGTYEFVESRATREDFLTVAALYESLKRVRRKPKAVAA